MIRLIGSLLALLAITLACVIAVYITLIYPDDSRVIVRNHLHPKVQNFSYSDKTALFKDQLRYQYDVLPGTYRNALANFRELYYGYIKLQSTRFSSPHQLYLSVGRYPHYVEGHDAIWVGESRSLKVFPKLAGRYSLNFKLVSFLGSGLIRVKKNGKEILALRASNVDLQVDRSWLSKLWHKYLNIEDLRSKRRWTTATTVIDVEPDDEISFACENSEWCFLSEPTFWKHGISKLQNTIVIVVDTVRNDAISSRITPNIWALGRQGILFNNAFGTGNLTSISTTSLLTCHEPRDLGPLVLTYGLTEHQAEAFYRKGIRGYIPELQKLGMQTTMIGNISIVSEIEGVGANYGFDQTIAIEKDAYEVPLITKRSIQWLVDHQSKPFFLYIHYNAPHAPYKPPIKDIISAWPTQAPMNAHTIFRTLYRGEVHFVDRYIAKLAKVIKDLHLEQKTNIIVTADHGEQQDLRAFRMNEAGKYHTGAFFDHGVSLNQDELRVPLIMLIPGQEARITDFPALSHDVGTTIAGIYQLSGSQCSGSDLLNIRPNDRKRVVGFTGPSQNAILLGGRYKYIRSNAVTERLILERNSVFRRPANIFVDEAVYDIIRDKHERVNLAKTDSKLLAQLRRHFDHYFDGETYWRLDIVRKEDSKASVFIDPRDWPKLADKFLRFALNVNMGRYELAEIRTRIKFTQEPTHYPVVIIDSKPIKTTLSSFRFAGRFSPNSLPSEQASSIPPATGSNFSVLMKIVRLKFNRNGIIIGNTRFKEIFREWGYLDDQG